MIVINSEHLQRIVTICAEFPRTDSINIEKAVVEDQYDGSLLSFDEAVKRVNKSAELCAQGGKTNLAIKEILECISDQDTFDTLILDAVDSLVIQRAGRRMVCLTRALPFGEEKTAGSRTVIIEIIDVLSRAAEMASTLQIKSADHTVAVIVMVTVVILAPVLYTLFRK